MKVASRKWQRSADRNGFSSARRRRDRLGHRHRVDDLLGRDHKFHAVCHRVGESLKLGRFLVDDVASDALDIAFEVAASRLGAPLMAARSIP